LCSKCHSYERAGIIKQALFQTEQEMRDIDARLAELRTKGVFPDEEEKNLFRTRAEFRILFHATDVPVIKGKTAEVTKELDLIESRIHYYFNELSFRRNFSVFIMIISVCIGIVIFLLSKTYTD
jgi:hypothetical protein